MAKKFSTEQNKQQHEFINKYEILKKITPLIENTMIRFNILPVEIELVKENHKWFLRIYIYSQDRNVTLDDCENVSRSLSDFLEELIPFKYNLEVSTPGLERKLKSNKEYLIFKGREIMLKVKEPFDETEDKQVVVKIMDFDEQSGLQIYNYKDKNEYTIPVDNIISARLYLNEI